MTLIRLGAQPFCWFCHVAAHLYLKQFAVITDCRQNVQFIFQWHGQTDRTFMLMDWFWSMDSVSTTVRWTVMSIYVYFCSLIFVNKSHTRMEKPKKHYFVWFFLYTAVPTWRMSCPKSTSTAVRHVVKDQMSRRMTKPTKWSVRPVKTTSAWASTQSDQTGRMPRLIWIFVGALHFVAFVVWWLKCFIMQIGKTLIRLSRCTYWFESPL